MMRVQQRYELPKLTPGRIIDDPTVWTGAVFPDDRSWVRPLTPPMVEEIDAAMRRARKRGVAPKDMTPADFPLDDTAPLLASLYRDLEAGPGFALLSGFPVDAYSYEEAVLAYCGLCSHLGRITVQNREGEYILDVTDKGKAYDSQQRGYHSSAHLGFHNDGTNTVILLCLETAAEGGESMLVSGPAVYNEIVRNAPEHLEALHRGFHHHRRDQREADDAPVTPYRTPVFGFFNDIFHMAYAGSSIFFCEDEGVTIGEAEKAALEYFASVVARPEMRLTMSLRKGDIQFVNNYVVLHSRTAYRDAPGRKRHLARLWLDDRNSRRLGPGKMDWYMPEQSRFTLQGGLAATGE
jgi:hypothetical protein